MVLAGPLGSGITKTGNADPTREPTFDSRLHESRREEGKRDRYVDLADAAALSYGNRFDIRNGARHQLIEPAPASRNCGDQPRASVSADGTSII